MDVSKFEDSYFKSSDKAEKKKGEDGFFETQTEKKELSSEYVENQKKVNLETLQQFCAVVLAAVAVAVAVAVACKCGVVITLNSVMHHP